MSEMKNSGLGYLGEIPSHWEIERVKNFLKFSPDRNPGNAMVLSLYREYGRYFELPFCPRRRFCC